ncbi:MAG: hypothetical protein HQK51_04015 [Oligoflexia bacterium]|nr:hypothetical protein [Oligoflexia bacterium]
MFSFFPNYLFKLMIVLVFLVVSIKAPISFNDGYFRTQINGAQAQDKVKYGSINSFEDDHAKAFMVLDVVSAISSVVNLYHTTGEVVIPKTTWTYSLYAGGGESSVMKPTNNGWVGNSKRNDDEYYERHKQRTIGRVFLASFLFISTFITIGLTAKQLDNVKKRLEILKNIRCNKFFTSKNSSNWPLNKYYSSINPGSEGEKDILRNIIDVCWDNFSSIKRTQTELRNLLSIVEGLTIGRAFASLPENTKAEVASRIKPICLSSPPKNQNNTMDLTDIGCKCRNDGSCLKLTSDDLGYLKNSKAANENIEVFNDLASQKIRYGERRDGTKIFDNMNTTLKQIDEVVKELNEKRAKKNEKPFLVLSEELHSKSDQFMSILKDEELQRKLMNNDLFKNFGGIAGIGLPETKLAGNKNFSSLTKKELSENSISINVLSPTPTVEERPISQNEKIENTKDTQDINDHKQHVYKTNSIEKNTLGSIWTMISLRYFKKFFSE